MVTNAINRLYNHHMLIKGFPKTVFNFIITVLFEYVCMWLWRIDSQLYVNILYYDVEDLCYHLLCYC